MIPIAWGEWEGLLDGVPASTSRQGLADPRVQPAVNFIGSPAVPLKDFTTYSEGTIVGASVLAVVPLGQYDPSKLINLGSNRWAFHSEVGLSKTWGKWTLEAAGGAWFYSDNGDFYGENTLSQDPLFVAKVNAVRSIRPGLWWAFGMGYGQGGRTFVDGVPRDTKQKNWRLTAIVVYPLSPTQGVSLTLASGRTFQAGPDFDVVALAYQVAWGGK